MFEIINGGLLTTVQDLGRYGYQKYGLGVSGAVDKYAHRMANILVCNKPSAATLEITLMGLHLRALKPTVVAITGGDLNPLLNGKYAPMWTSFKMKKNDVLHFKNNVNGCRAYLAVAGGIDVASKLGSRSTDLLSRFGGFSGRALQQGDIVKTNNVIKQTRRIGRRIPPQFIPQYLHDTSVRVILGPQQKSFTEEGIQTFFSSRYKVSLDSNRMACRLEGQKIEHKNVADIQSEGMFVGAIQIPKSGLPIVFQSERPSVGGYTKIAGVITIDQPKIAQLKPGDYVRFKKTTLRKAHQLYHTEEQLFKWLNMSF